MTYTYAISPLAVLIAAIVLAEPVTAWLVAGGALVVGGIVLAQRPPGKARSASVEAWASAPSRSAS